MADKRNYYKKGLNQTEYRRDKAKLERFNALESDWKKIFRWIMSVVPHEKFHDPKRKKTEKLIGIWRNHVLTVLIEIIQKNTEEYKETFVQSRGSSDQKMYIKNLKEKIVDWNNRLDSFLRSRWLDDRISPYDTSIQAAQSIQQHLTNALQGKNVEKYQPGRSLNPANQPYYQMLQTIKTIKSQSEGYIRMIEDSGTMDASLALLLVYIRNYCFIADKFNRSLLSLPEYYHNEILRTAERKVVQDYTYVVVNPLKEGFTLYENTKFLAGKNTAGETLSYHTEASKYLTGAKLAKTCSVFLQKELASNNKLYTQEITLPGVPECNILFDKNVHSDVAAGWLLESHMFILEEGKRKVSTSFLLTNESASYLESHRIPESSLSGAFDIYASYTEGWMDYVPVISIERVKGRTRMTFAFTMTETEYSLSPCQEKTHNYVSTYPCIRILMNNKNCPYDWAKAIEFNQISIDVEVEGIRHFNLYNELGEIDSTQPFYPFGTQGDRGAWFMFCNDEISRKTVQEVSLNGIWNKLPQLPGGYTDIYKNYPQNPPLTNQSFQIKKEYLKNDKWYSCPNGLSPLFQEQNEELKEDAEIHFHMMDEQGMPIALQSNLPNTTNSRRATIFFRVVLNTPPIGFGMEEYRRLFAETMIYNSHQKEKGQKEIPPSPVIPLLSDMKLSYKASWESDDGRAIPMRLLRITDFAEYEECILFPYTSFPFLESLKAERNLYLKFAGITSDKKICMYVDLSYVKKDMFLPDSSFESASSYLEINFRKNGKWVALYPENILLEETYGLTQNGFIEIVLPQELLKIPTFWLRLGLKGTSAQYPAIRDIYLNCLKVIADNGDGFPLPAGTIQKMQPEDRRVGSILQPLPGFGGRAKETVSEVSIRQSARIAHRNRAVAPRNYEQMVLDQFPDILKAHCLPRMCTGKQEVYIVVFSYTDGNPYPMTPTWKLSEIRNWLSARISPFVSLKVCNPSYQKVDIACEAILEKDVEDEGEIRRRMTRQVREYFALWLEIGELPDLGTKYSYKELHTRLANDEDIVQLVSLTINGIQPDVQATDINAEDQYIPDEHAPIGTVLIPYDIRIVLLPFKDGLGKIEIGSNFKIG